MLDKNLNLFPLFPDLIAWGKLNLSNEELNIAREFIKQEEHVPANLHGTFASKNKFILEKEDFYFLKKAINSQVNNFVKNYLKIKPVFKLISSWSTLTKPGANSHLHKHFHSMLSAVAYITVPPDSGEISFTSSKTNFFEIESIEKNIYNSNDIKFTPEENTVVIFPSQLLHEVLTNNSKFNRVSIGCTYLPIGFVGTGESTYRFE